MHQSPEQRLLAAAMMRRIDDALFPLSLSSPVALDRQKQTLAKKARQGKAPIWCVRRSYDYRNAIAWLESDALDWYADAIGYDSEFVARTVKLIQECLTWKAQRGLRPPLTPRRFSDAGEYLPPNNSKPSAPKPIYHCPRWQIPLRVRTHPQTL